MGLSDLLEGCRRSYKEYLEALSSRSEMEAEFEKQRRAGSKWRMSLIALEARARGYLEAEAGISSTSWERLLGPSPFQFRDP